MKAVAETLGVSRSNLHERRTGSAKPRSAYRKAGDAALLPRIRRLVAERPTYGYRRITAVLKRDYVHVTPLPDAETVLKLFGAWIEDYNENHPHSGLKWRSPREFIRARTETA